MRGGVFTLQQWQEHLKQIIGEVLIDEAALHKRLDELAEQINHDYQDIQAERLVVVGILRGSVLFMSDLVRRLQMPVELDFMSASSYGGTESTGTVRITKDIGQDIRGKHVLLVEDIIDTGNTMSRLIPMLQKRNPASLKLCSLLNKPSRRLCEVNIDYQGFEIEDKFVVGYGLDYNGNYRHLPVVAVLKPECYA